MTFPVKKEKWQSKPALPEDKIQIKSKVFV